MPVTMRGGKQYLTVIERLTPALGDTARPTGITSIHTDVIERGNLIIVHARITFASGQVFDGLSEAKMDAKSGADVDAPIECAETSAVGRALANAGYFGGDDGLAGAEEIQSAQRRAENRARAQAPHASAPQRQATSAPQAPQQPRQNPAATPAKPTPTRQAPANVPASSGMSVDEARKRTALAMLYPEWARAADEVGVTYEPLESVQRAPLKDYLGAYNVLVAEVKEARAALASSGPVPVSDEEAREWPQ